MKDEERILDDARRDAWPAAEPPAGFAERVLAARRAELAAAPRRWRRGFIVAATAALVAAGAALFLAVRPPAPAQAGSLVASARTEVAIGARAVGVAEPGTALAWRVTGDEARVEQTRGDVFYRVERGGRFVVATPGGDVIVRGTCFRVEVMEMKIGKQAIIGAGAGALVTAAVMVTVYEGRVALANDKGSTEVRAGERATAGGGAAPGPAVAVVRAAKPGAAAVEVAAPPPPASDATREQLLARDAAQRKEIAELRAQLAAAAAPGGRRPLETKSFMSPTKDELLAMAKECVVQFDTPDLSTDPVQIPARLAAKVGLSPDELVAVNRVREDVSRRTLAQLRAIYAEITGNAPAAEDLNAEALQREIMDKTGRDEMTEAARQLSQERAGLAPPPDNLAARPPGERALRVMSAVGDELERELAKAIGPDKAHALRATNDGWPSRAKMGGCARGGDDGEGGPVDAEQTQTVGGPPR